jgi:hypothetical protein
MDRKEFKVLLDPKESEFQLVQDMFKPMSDSKHILTHVWRIQNENLWANFSM